MTLSEELKWRGFINQTTLKDLKTLDSKKRTFYMGFDASADSQTIGNLAAMMFARCFLRNGYDGVLLAGGATSLIGDPGGKDKERDLQGEAVIAKNVAAAGKQIRQVLTGYDFKLVNNLDWTRDLKVIPFLRDIGKHFSMTPLIQRDYIANRLGEKGSGISYAEFSYTILQGNDYLHLFDKYGVTLQLGGSDQWGNCLSGVELVRKVRGKEVDAITLNLIIDKATGKKFGKSEGGAVWLDAKKTSPAQFYQFWLNTGDDSVEDYLKIYTDLDKTDIEKVMREFKTNKASRHAQRVLAAEVTSLVHGKEGLKDAEASARAITGEASSAEVSTGSGTSVVDLLVKSGLASSKTEARQLIAGGGVYINGVQSRKETIEKDDFEEGLLKLRRGKTLKNTVIVKLK